jgi:hypothetical protein
MMITSLVAPGFGNRWHFLTGKALIVLRVMAAPTPRE